MRIDSHVHLWRIDRGDYGWMTDAVAPIRRDYGLDDLLPRLDAAGLDQAILVQAAPTEAETAFLLDIATSSERIAGVVGWVDLLAPSAERSLRDLAAQPKALGIRPMLQDIPDTLWVLQPRVLDGLALTAEFGLVFDALVQPRHLPAVALLADHLPRLRIVVDHGAKPAIASRSLGRWALDLAALAQRPNVVCKLSGLATEAGPGWSIEQLRRVLDQLFAVFGPSRLLFGSDWPVLDLVGSYADWFATVQSLLDGHSATDRDAVLGRNAARIYRIGQSRR